MLPDPSVLEECSSAVYPTPNSSCECQLRQVSASGLIASSDCLGKAPEDQTSFGNDHYRIVFQNRDQRGVYGRSYNFFLQDAVDVGEHLVLWDDFVALAAEYRLLIRYKKTFHEVFQEERYGHGGVLLKKMGVSNGSGEILMSDAEWDIARKLCQTCLARCRN